MELGIINIEVGSRIRNLQEETFALKIETSLEVRRQGSFVVAVEGMLWPQGSLYDETKMSIQAVIKRSFR